jgi:hypothetical protein
MHEHNVLTLWHEDNTCYTSTNDLKKPIYLFFKINLYYKLFMKYYFLMKTVMKLVLEINEGLLMHSNIWKYIYKKSCYKFPINKALGLGLLRFCSLTKPQNKFTHLFGEPFCNSTSPQYTLWEIIPLSRASK